MIKLSRGNLLREKSVTLANLSFPRETVNKSSFPRTKPFSVTTAISYAWNRAELQGSCFMHAASGGHTRFPTIKKSKMFENLNDGYVISKLMFATWK